MRRRVPRCRSSSATLRLTLGSGDLSLRLPAEMLPASTTAKNTSIASRRSITNLVVLNAWSLRLTPRRTRMHAYHVPKGSFPKSQATARPHTPPFDPHAAAAAQNETERFNGHRLQAP